MPIALLVSLITQLIPLILELAAGITKMVEESDLSQIEKEGERASEIHE